MAVLSEQQNQFDLELNKIQVQKEMDRFKLIEQLQEGKFHTHSLNTRFCNFNTFGANPFHSNIKVTLRDPGIAHCFVIYK